MFNLSSFKTGKSFCNLIANKYINELSKIDSKHKSRITVSDHEKFIVINGYTSISNHLNFSETVNSYINELGINRSLNIIDLVEFGYKKKQDDQLRIINSYKEHLIVNDFIDQLESSEFYDVDINFNKKIIYSNTILSPDFMSRFSDYTFYSTERTYPVVSDSFYGSSLDLEKIYSFYTKYISYNIFQKQLCRDLVIDIKISDTENITHDTIDLSITSNTKITSQRWLESMILDLFDVNPENIINKFDLDLYDFESDIINQKGQVWSVRDMTKEMIIF